MTWAYAGLITVVSDPAGNITTQRHDPAGQVTQVLAPLGSNAFYHYNAAGQLLSLTDADGHTRHYSYDQRGLLSSTDDPNAGVRHFSHDVFGQLVMQSDGKDPATVTTMTYDQLGRPVSRTEPEGSTTWQYRKAAGFGRGLLYHVKGPMGAGSGLFEEYRVYNQHSLLQRSVTIIDGEVYQTDYAYGGEGKLEELIYPSTVGWRPKFRFSHTYGHLQSITQEAVGMIPIYTLGEMDAWGRDRHAILGAGAISTQRDHDPASGQLVSIHSEAPGYPISLQDYSYEWDSRGNLTSRSNRLAGMTHIEQFSYDALGRLVESSLGNSPPVTLSYSASGNILSKSDTGQYSYGGNGAGPHAVTQVSGGPRGTLDYSYDANGNMIRRGGLPISWTSFNQPLQISVDDGLLRFGYGPDRNRVRQESVAGGQSTTTHYVGPHFEVEMEGSNKRYRSTVFAYGRAVTARWKPPRTDLRPTICCTTTRAASTALCWRQAPAANSSCSASTAGESADSPTGLPTPETIGSAMITG